MKKIKLLFFLALFSLLPAILYCQYVIPVGSYPCALVYNATNAKLYCANFGDNTVSVINVNTNQVIATIRTGTGPVALVYNSTSNKVYCANQQSNDVSIINGAINEVINTVTVGSYPSKLLFNPATNKIYCSNSSSNTISLIDGVNDNVIATVNVGGYPTALTYNSANNKIYCANTDDESVSIIDGVANQVIATVPVGRTPNSLAYNPDNNEVYCASWSNGRIHMIDGATNQKVDSIIYGNSGPQSLIFAYNNRMCYVNFTGDNIKMISGTSDTIIASCQFPVGTRPYALSSTFWADDFVYCANIGSNNINAFNTYWNNFNTMWTINGINYPITIHNYGHGVYVTNLWSSTVTEVIHYAIEEQYSSKNGLIPLTIYPNPAKSYFTIQIPSDEKQSSLKIFDLSGKLVRIEELKKPADKEHRVSTYRMDPGIYFVQLDNQSSTTKLIITK